MGHKVVAIGNALGQLQNTVTSGIISGHGRNVQASDQAAVNVENLQNLFQTDAAINQGNSGGPLVNIYGEVIGINTAIAGDAQAIGFSIPINDIGGLVKSVLQKGKLLRPYLGVRYLMLNGSLASQYKLSVKEGAYIIPSTASQPSIVSGSPADKAGLRPKDVIIRVNDTKINERNVLASVLGRYAVGESLTLTIIRDGKTRTVQVTLESLPNN